MVQPKKPPVSLRIPDALLARIDAIAVSLSGKRHAVILAMLETGVQRYERLPVDLRTGGEADIGVLRVKNSGDLDVKIVPPKPAVHVEAPLYERKAFNPQQKTGKAKR